MARRPRILSHQLEAIEYVHADDGLPYRHDVTGRTRIELAGDGTARLRDVTGAPVWALYDGQPFFENPPMKKSKRRTARRVARRSASGQFLPSRSVSRSSPSPSVSLMAKKSKKSRHAKKSRGGRRHRRNPPSTGLMESFRPASLVKNVTEGVVHGFQVLAGDAVAGFTRQALGFAPNTVTGAGVELLVGLGYAAAANRFIGRDAATYGLAGVCAKIERRFLVQLATSQLKAAPAASKFVIDALSGFDTIAAYPIADKGAAGPSSPFGETPSFLTPLGTGQVALGSYPIDSKAMAIM